MPFQRVSIREEMETLKHLPGGHDQRNHGRRGKRGGGAAAIFARQKAQLDSLWLTPEQRADLESRLERASQHAAETDEMRQARLYDKDGNYTADIPTRRAFYDEMNKRGQQLAQDIQRDDPTQNNHTRVMQRAREIMQQYPDEITVSLALVSANLNSAHLDISGTTGSKELDDLISQHHAYRAGMELVTRTYLAQPTPAKLNMRVSSGLNADTLQTDIAPYLHMAPPDSVRFNVENFAYTGWNAYAYYEPANVPQYQSDGTTISTVPTLYISNSADSSQDGRYTRAHEFGHHVENNKVGGYTIADTYTRNRMGDDIYRQVISMCDKQADEYDNDTKIGKLQEFSFRNGYYDMTDYSRTVYRGKFYGTDENGTRKEIGRTTTTEVVSVFYEHLAQPIQYDLYNRSGMPSQFFLETLPGSVYGEAASHQTISYIVRRTDANNTFAHLYAVSHY